VAATAVATCFHEARPLSWSAAMMRWSNCAADPMLVTELGCDADICHVKRI
jgi:hypothetical protein